MSKPPTLPESWASSDAVRAVMRANRRRDSGPEMRVRRLLHGLGLRYRVDFAPLPGARRRRADVVFTRARVAVFIDGCFWHGCPRHCRPPRTNADFWRAKLRRNQERDAETDTFLAAAGWVSLRYWEHEDPEIVARRVADVVWSRRSPA